MASTSMQSMFAPRSAPVENSGISGSLPAAPTFQNSLESFTPAEIVASVDAHNVMERGIVTMLEGAKIAESVLQHGLHDDPQREEWHLTLHRAALTRMPKNDPMRPVFEAVIEAALTPKVLSAGKFLTVKPITDAPQETRQLGIPRADTIFAVETREDLPQRPSMADFLTLAERSESVGLESPDAHTAAVLRIIDNSDPIGLLADSSPFLRVQQEIAA